MCHYVVSNANGIKNRTQSPQPCLSTAQIPLSTHTEHLTAVGNGETEGIKGLPLSS